MPRIAGGYKLPSSSLLQRPDEQQAVLDNAHRVQLTAVEPDERVDVLLRPGDLRNDGFRRDVEDPALRQLDELENLRAIRVGPR